MMMNAWKPDCTTGFQYDEAACDGSYCENCLRLLCSASMPHRRRAEVGNASQHDISAATSMTRNQLQKAVHTGVSISSHLFTMFPDPHSNQALKRAV